MCKHKRTKTEVYISQSQNGQTRYSFGWLFPGDYMGVNQMPSGGEKCIDCGKVIKDRHPDFESLLDD